ncbi:MAG: metalloregulator ArsR/SmtB family transcription factor [Anaerolineae bacterium]|nr:metalloregulator ArsR/SmtB family transcription factor [Anaerolineae bacterium]
MTDPIAFAKAIADDTRQRIMKLCCCERLTVTEITAKMFLTQPTVSHHLAILRDAGLVNIERQGRETYYSLNQTFLTVCCGTLMSQFAPNEPVTATVKQELLMPD